jgi:hypothetical protein
VESYYKQLFGREERGAIRLHNIWGKCGFHFSMGSR